MNDYAPQYNVSCPKCGCSAILNRGEPITKGFLWWKKTFVPSEEGYARCPEHGKFYYSCDLNNLKNAYPTAIGISPQEAFGFMNES